MSDAPPELPACWQASAAVADTVTREVGALTIRHERPGSLLRLALTLTNRNGKWSAFDMKPATGKQWRRWPAPEDARVESHPALPNSPLVLRLRYPLTVTPGTEARCYAAIPLWAQLRAVGAEQSVDLADVPTRVMSNAWWGTPQNGTMCYSLPGYDLLSPPPDNPDTTALCRIRVTTEDKEEPVTVTLLRIPGPELTLYRDVKTWWTSDLHIHLRSDGDQEETVTSEPPADADSPTTMTPPRSVPGQNSVRRFVRDPLAFIGR